MANGSFLSATVNRDRSRINFNHFEKLINNFHRSKTPVSLAFTFGVRQHTKILTPSKLHIVNGRNFYG